MGSKCQQPMDIPIRTHINRSFLRIITAATIIRLEAPTYFKICRHLLANVCGSRVQLGGRVVRWCWVIFRCQGVLLIWIIAGQGPIALAEGAGGGGLDIFFLVYHFFLPPSLWETARYRLKHCLKGPLSHKQPAKQLSSVNAPPPPPRGLSQQLGSQ